MHALTWKVHNIVYTVDDIMDFPRESMHTSMKTRVISSIGAPEIVMHDVKHT